MNKTKKSKFTKLSKWLKDIIIDYLPMEDNVEEYVQLDKQVQDIILKKISLRHDIAKLCIAIMKAKHDFTSNWRNSMFEIFLNDELYFHKNSELINSWNEPLVVIFLDCFEKKPNIDNFRLKVEHFLEIYRHYESCWFRILKQYWIKRKKEDNFLTLFYLKSKFRLVDYYKNKYFMLDDS